MIKKKSKIIETLAHGYSTEGTQWELSNGYQHDRVQMFFKRLCFGRSSLSIEKGNNLVFAQGGYVRQVWRYVNRYYVARTRS